MQSVNINKLCYLFQLLNDLSEKNYKDRFWTKKYVQRF